MHARCFHSVWFVNCMSGKSFYHQNEWKHNRKFLSLDRWVPIPNLIEYRNFRKAKFIFLNDFFFTNLTPDILVAERLDENCFCLFVCSFVRSFNRSETFEANNTLALKENKKLFLFKNVSQNISPKCRMAVNLLINVRNLFRQQP